MAPPRLGTRIQIDESSRIPPFEQLRAQLALMVASGRFSPGDRLPTIRGLAESLQLSNGTVARAYRELEIQGVIIGRGRRGTFVSDDPPITFSAQERRRDLEAALLGVELATELPGSEQLQAALARVPRSGSAEVAAVLAEPKVLCEPREIGAPRAMRQVLGDRIGRVLQ